MLAPTPLALLLAMLSTAAADPITLSTSSNPLNATSQLICAQNVGCQLGSIATLLGSQVQLSSLNLSSPLPQTATFLPGTYSAPASGLGSDLLQPFLRLPTTASLPGFHVASTASSIQVTQDTGIVLYSGRGYSNQAASVLFGNSPLQNLSTTFSPQSMIISSGLYAAINMRSNGGTKRLIFWNSVPDSTQLGPSINSGNWDIQEVQSASCSVPCASGGYCTLNSTCTCYPGFTGATCNQCAPGFYGARCQQCKSCSNGTNCKDGIVGTGECTELPAKVAARSCNCANGICSATDSCSCNPGWADAKNGTRCAVCAPGFFQTDSGDCSACFPGCTACEDVTGRCTSCQQGLQTSSDNVRTCIITPFLPENSTTFESCRDGQFLNDKVCSDCAASCATCFGAAPNQCLACTGPRGLLAGSCVTVDPSTGICDISQALNAQGKIAWVFNKSKSQCDTLPAGCTAGKIPNFNSAGISNQLQCTSCLDGMAIINGACVESCPDGFYNNAGTCAPCDATCATCLGSATVCTACTSGNLVQNGRCIPASSCLSGNFANNGTCTACHPDCGTCAEAFDQCTSCSPTRPVLSQSKTCVPTCSSNQYYDSSSSSCQTCDTSCTTCSGAGPSNCLSCPGTAKLNFGSCSPANCLNSTTVIAGLGLCLSDLAGPLPAITPPADAVATKDIIKWTAIGVGILLLVIILILAFRRHQVKKRKQKTKGFATKKGVHPDSLWSRFWRGKDMKGETDDVESPPPAFEIQPPVYASMNPYSGHRPYSSAAYSASHYSFDDEASCKSFLKQQPIPLRPLLSTTPSVHSLQAPVIPAHTGSSFNSFPSEPKEAHISRYTQEADDEQIRWTTLQRKESFPRSIRSIEREDR